MKNNIGKIVLISIGIVILFLACPLIQIACTTDEALNNSLSGLQFILLIPGLVCFITGLVLLFRKQNEKTSAILVSMILGIFVCLLICIPYGFQTIRAIPVFGLIFLPFIGVLLLVFPLIRRKRKIFIPIFVILFTLNLFAFINISRQNGKFYDDLEAEYKILSAQPLGHDSAPPDKIVSVVYDLDKKDFVRVLNPPANASDVTVIIFSSRSEHNNGEWWWVDAKGNKVAFDHSDTNVIIHKQYVNVKTWSVYNAYDD